MRNVCFTVLFFVLLIIFSLPSYSQESVSTEALKIKKWTLGTVGIRIGGYEDHYHNLLEGYLLATVGCPVIGRVPHQRYLVALQEFIRDVLGGLERPCAHD